MADTQRIYRLLVDANQANRQLKKTNTELSKFGDGIKNVGRQIKGSFAGALAGLSLAQFSRQLKGAIEELDNIAKTADSIGVAVESLQELEFAAARSGVSSGLLTSSLTAFAKRMGELRQNTGPLAQALKKYDTTLLENLRNTTNQDEALALISDKMATVTDATEQAFLANAAFSRSGIRMTGILRNGSDALDDLRQSARDAGTVVEESLTRKAEVLNDRWDTLTDTISTQFTKGLLVLADSSLQLMGIYSSEDDIVRELNKNQLELIKLRRQADGASPRALQAKRRQIKAIEDEQKALEDQLTTLESAKKARDNLAKSASGNGGIIDEKEISNLEKYANALKTSILTPAETVQAELLKLDEAFKKNLLSHQEYIKGVDKAYKELAESVDSVADNELSKFADNVLQKLKTPAEQLDQELRKLDQAFKEYLLTPTEYAKAIEQAYQRAGNAADEVKTRTKESNDELTDFLNDFESGLTRWSQDTSDAFVEMAYSGKASFTDLANTVIKQLAKMAVQAYLVKPIFDQIGSVFTTTNAHGNVYDSKGLVPFAQGGIVSQPTVFPFANGIGLMGEAGPEAILPLSRDSSGDLGVKGGATQINVYNNTNAKATVEETETASGKRIDVLIENAVDSAISRGRFDKSMNGIYGLRRRGT